MNLSVRKARMGDIRAIHALLMTSSADGLLLPRSLTDLYGHLRDFFVVEGDGATVGCGALSIIWENMAEVRSLDVVLPSGAGPEIRLRTVSRPEPRLAVLLQRLGLLLPEKPKRI